MPVRLAVPVVLAAAAAAAPQAPARPAPPPPAEASPPADAAALYSTRGDEKVHLVSLPDLRSLASYDAGAGAHELAISADGRFALGSAYGGPGQGHQPADNRVFVLDLPAGARARTIDLGASKRPNDLAFVGAGTIAVATTEAPPQLLRLDAANGTVEAFALEHRANHMLALAPDARACFVSHVMPGGITRFDLARNTATAYAELPAGAEGIACVAHGDAVHVWVGCARSDRIVVVDGATLAVLHTIPRAGFPFRLKASPDGARVAVSCPKSGEVVIHDARDPTRPPAIVDLRTQLDTEQVAPTSIAWSPDGTQVLVVANGEPDRIVAIDAAHAKVTAQIEAAGPIADALAAGRVLPPTVVR